MESTKKLILFALCTAFCLDQVASNPNSDNNERQIYIAYMGELPKETTLLMDAHHNILSEAIGDETMARKSKICSYTRSFNGFAAQLLPHEAELLSRIWVDSPSFNDTGLGPPPSKWKGKCAKLGANFTGQNKKYNCSNVPRARGSDGLNYPSMNLQVESNASDISGVFYRTLTNVGSSNSRYKAKITTPKGFSIEVTPNVLHFNKLKQHKSFKVTVKGKAPRQLAWYLSGSLLWSDSKHHVRSPILVASYI